MDIQIEVGDRVTSKNKGTGKIYVEIAYNNVAIENMKSDLYNTEIIKIERPHYEVVEEKKELLTEEEKEFLKSILRYYKATTIYFDVDRVLFFDDIIEEISPNYPKGLKFEGVKKHTQYDLEELGLEEK